MDPKRARVIMTLITLILVVTSLYYLIKLAIEDFQEHTIEDRDSILLIRLIYVFACIAALSRFNMVYITNTLIFGGFAFTLGLLLFKLKLLGGGDVLRLGSMGSLLALLDELNVRFYHGVFPMKTGFTIVFGLLTAFYVTLYVIYKIYSGRHTDLRKGVYFPLAPFLLVAYLIVLYSGASSWL